MLSVTYGTILFKKMAILIAGECTTLAKWVAGGLNIGGAAFSAASSGLNQQVCKAKSAK